MLACNEFFAIERSFGVSQIICGLAIIIALFSGWSLCWQLVFGEFEGVWGDKKNRGNLAIAFVVSVTVTYATLN